MLLVQQQCNNEKVALGAGLGAALAISAAAALIMLVLLIRGHRRRPDKDTSRMESSNRYIGAPEMTRNQALNSTTQKPSEMAATQARWHELQE